MTDNEPARTAARRTTVSLRCARPDDAADVAALLVELVKAAEAAAGDLGCVTMEVTTDDRLSAMITCRGRRVLTPLGAR